jgi:hypothetical protein
LVRKTTLALTVATVIDREQTGLTILTEENVRIP